MSFTLPTFPPKSSYPRTRTQSLRAAMAEAIATRLYALRFDVPGGPTMFAEVYAAWPDPESHYVTPAAVVLPGPGTYEDAGLTPTLLDDTWEPQGRPGWGLYKTAELVVPFEVQVRCPTDAERDVVVATVEDSWIADGVLMDHRDGPRYGVVLEMPGYWGTCASFSLLSSRVMDDAEGVMRGQREATFQITGRAAQVKLGPVQPLKVTVRQTLT